MGRPGNIEPDDLRSIPTFRAAYSDRTALLMARLAQRAYEPFQPGGAAFATFPEAFAKLGLTDFLPIVDDDVGTAGFITAGPELIAIVFRGTEDLLDWRTNMRLAWVVLQGGVHVHTGFFQAYWPIRPALFAEIVRLIAERPRPVYLTGHSLGGALAAMATAELANHDRAEVRDSIAACYTFGCPKIGDRSFDRYVQVPLYRITSGVDLVPAVPPFVFGYRQAGDTRYFGPFGVAPLRRAPNIFRQAFRTVWGLLEFFRTRTILGIADHSMARYVEKMEKWVAKASKEAEARRKETADPDI